MAHPALAHRAAGALPITAPPVGGLDADALRDAVRVMFGRIERDKPLRAKFGGDLDAERTKLGAFLAERYGGGHPWNGAYAHGDVAGPHRFIHITAADAERWLDHARHGLTGAVGEAAGAAVVADLRPIALALVNEVEAPPAGAKREARFAPSRAAIAACAKGDLDEVRRLLDASPHLVAPKEPGSPELLHAAAAKGRVAVVEELIRRGIDVNRPARVGSLMLTALCAAQVARRTPVVDALLAAGALDDLFTAAFAGDADSLDATLRDDPRLANEPDPASDFFFATVVDHAVLGRDPSATLAIACRHGATSPPHGHQLLRAAGDAGRAGVVEQLLAIGADAAAVTPGRWVLDAASARLLLDAGADVNHAPTRWQSWIWLACTGNNGKRDTPELVRALLDAGADVHARAFGATALHFAAKAGFVATVELLLARGADPNAVDDKGRTPLDLVRADRPTMSDLLRAAQSG